MERINKIAQIATAIAVLCAALITLHKTFGFHDVLAFLFVLLGGFGTITSFVYSLKNPEKSQFNWLFWIGTFIIFTGFCVYLSKFERYFPYFLIGGSFITGISYFIQIKTDEEKSDEPLDKM